MGKRARGMGWLPDYPDIRDYTFARRELLERDEIRAMVRPVGVVGADDTVLPPSADLRKWCPPVEDQGGIGSCTANAGAGIVEYYEKRAFGRHLDASRLFLYKVTRNLAQLEGDSGAYIRSTMGALVLFGVPPERFWPYTDETPGFDNEPSAFCYSFAESYRSIRYFRHDPAGSSEAEVLGSVRKSLAAGVPSMFGFTVYSSISQATRTGKIPFPAASDRVLGGHAVVAVGYDDKVEMRSDGGDASTEGALLIRNSWGDEWGEAGYGWLPYDYVLRGLSADFWSMLKQEWVDTRQFTVR